jgi:hypothetical protein
VVSCFAFLLAFCHLSLLPLFHSSFILSSVFPLFDYLSFVPPADITIYRLTQTNENIIMDGTHWLRSITSVQLTHRSAQCFRPIRTLGFMEYINDHNF